MKKKHVYVGFAPPPPPLTLNRASAGIYAHTVLYCTVLYYTVLYSTVQSLTFPQIP